MKTRVAFIVLLVGLYPVTCLAQLANGGRYALFGVDADTRAYYMKYGILRGNLVSDDWFAPYKGTNVIDTSNSAYYLSLLQGGSNVSFSKRMSQLLYAKVTGKLWLDAAYGRDFSSAASLKDSTVFTASNKNGDDPNTWTGGLSSTPTKNDLVDVYAHMRRDGSTIYDSLWFFTAITAYGAAANSYYDVELYKAGLTYHSTTGTFTAPGTAGGHTEWLFDASGNITQTGDLIVAVSFAPGSVPVIDVRIWVSQPTYTTWYGGAQTPKYFNFSSNYSASGSYGYASILSKAGTTAFGAGIANYSATPAADTTYATPWGTANNSTGWSSQYQSEQLIEVGLNLTRMGVDPALYSTLNPCQSLYANIFFASRSSSSFTAALQDFVAPLTFLRNPVMDYTETTDTLRCNHTTATINLTNVSTAGYYTWQAVGGGAISGANSDSSQLSITKAGTYIVSASPAQGCPATRVDTLVIPMDTVPPTAMAFSGFNGPNINLFGSGSSGSSPFGSQPLSWNWTGPNGFTGGTQNPSVDTANAWGTYTATVTGSRNGCTTTTTTDVISSMYITLLSNGLQLRGNYAGQAINLGWQDLDRASDLSFEVERSDGAGNFQPIGVVRNGSIVGNGPGSFNFRDEHPYAGVNLYRVKATTVNGNVYYSPNVSISAGLPGVQSAYLAMSGTSEPALMVRTGTGSKAEMVEYLITGQIVARKAVTLVQGDNQLSLPAVPARGMYAIALYVDGQVAWAQQVVR